MLEGFVAILENLHHVMNYDGDLPKLWQTMGCLKDLLMYTLSHSVKACQCLVLHGHILDRREAYDPGPPIMHQFVYSVYCLPFCIHSLDQ